MHYQCGDHKVYGWRAFPYVAFGLAVLSVPGFLLGGLVSWLVVLSSGGGACP